MKKQTVILILFIFSYLAVDAQESYIKNRWNIKASYASYPGQFISKHGIKNSFGNYRIETNYGLFNCLEIGGYLGYSRTSALYVITGGGLVYENMNTPFFGLNLNFHPLGFLIKKRDFRLDFYLLGRYGGSYYATPEGYNVPTKGFYSEIRHGAGLSFYLTKHIGIFGEYSFGILAKPSGNLRFGVSVKF